MRVFFTSRRFARLLSLMLCLLPASAPAWEGVVWDVVDGDTLAVVPAGLDNAVGAGVGIRLYGIDAPEMNQPSGPESKAALAAMVKPGDLVEIIPIESDRYDRSVALVIYDHTILNMEQVRGGQAKVSAKYCRARFCRDWQKIEAGGVK